MQQGNSLGDVFFNRPAEAIEEAKKQRMEAELLDQFNKSRGGGLVNIPGAAGNIAGISFDINESPKNRKMRGVRKLAETGVGGEKDAALEILKKTGGPQLPLVMGNPLYQMGNMAGVYGPVPFS